MGNFQHRFPFTLGKELPVFQAEDVTDFRNQLIETVSDQDQRCSLLNDKRYERRKRL